MTDDAKLSRRTAMGLFSLFGAACAFPKGLYAATQDRLGSPIPFTSDGLIKRAQILARTPYIEVPNSVHAANGYDEAVKLTFGQADHVAGNVRLFPTVKDTAPKPISISILENGQSREILDTTGLFVGNHKSDPAGFRIMDQGGQSDWLAYQGTNYFRSSGSRDQYGLSARAVAIDTGLPKAEEFPTFTHFWIEQTGTDAARIYALLDGPSLTGAYTFDCRKTAQGVVQDVTASLFLRKNVEQLGIAAASSMFWYDQSSRASARKDWRPEIHDSDGLAILSGDGERIWRPLNNASVTQLHSLQSKSPRGFGLLQRDQVFDHYQDDGVFYDRRPCLWVEPKGNWGEGAIYLYEIATESEVMDNIAIFWSDRKPARAGQRRDFAYRLTWSSQDPSANAGARCIDSYEGMGGIPGAPPTENARKFVFDFSGPSLNGLTRDSGVTPETNIPSSALVSATAYPVARSDNLWRVMLDVRPKDLPQSQFRLFLKRGTDVLSETVIKSVQS